MVFLNVSGQRGMKTLFNYKLCNFAPDLTLRLVADSVLREDAADMARVEAREKIDDQSKTDIEGEYV